MNNKLEKAPTRDQVKAYLEKTGWQFLYRTEIKSEIWQHPDLKQHNNVPLWDYDGANYRQNEIQCIAYETGKTELDIYNDIMSGQ